MKHTARILAVAALLATFGTAHADIERSTLVIDGPPIQQFGVTLSDLAGNGTLVFSESLIGALEVAGIQTAAVAPATVDITTTEAGTRISANAPILSMAGDFDPAASQFTPRYIHTLGGASMVAPKKNFATTTGSLSLTDIRVDLGTKAIYANLTGGNGVGQLTSVHVWDYALIDGPTSVPFTTGNVLANNKLTGLVITDTAFNLFAKSLGLTSGGIAAMREITDYGVMESQIGFHMQAPVPEPSTYALVGIGLVGLALATRARQA